MSLNGESPTWQSMRPGSQLDDVLSGDESESALMYGQVGHSTKLCDRLSLVTVDGQMCPGTVDPQIIVHA